MATETEGKGPIRYSTGIWLQLVLWLHLSVHFSAMKLTTCEWNILRGTKPNSRQNGQGQDRHVRHLSQSVDGEESEDESQYTEETVLRFCGRFTQIKTEEEHRGPNQIHTDLWVGGLIMPQKVTMIPRDLEHALRIAPANLETAEVSQKCRWERAVGENWMLIRRDGWGVPTWWTLSGWIGGRRLEDCTGSRKSRGEQEMMGRNSWGGDSQRGGLAVTHHSFPRR